jgi:hypothetical protein
MYNPNNGAAIMTVLVQSAVNLEMVRIFKQIMVLGVQSS